jgi:hypothetical protein
LGVYSDYLKPTFWKKVAPKPTFWKKVAPKPTFWKKVAPKPTFWKKVAPKIINKLPGAPPSQVLVYKYNMLNYL